MSARHDIPPLRPDPQLPHRDRLLQDSLIADWLSQHLSPSGPVRVDAFERARVKYRIGESMRVVYRLRAGGTECTVAARTFRPGRSGPAFLEAARNADAVTGFRGVMHAAELDTVFWTYPNDRKLAELSMLQAPAARLAAALGVRRLRTRVVAYAPEKCATAECRSESGETLGYAKVYADDQAQRAVATYRAVQRAGGAHVPRLLAVPSHRTLVLDAIGGRSLSRLPAAAQEEAFEGLGRALASLHALPAPAEPFRRLSADRLQAAAALIASVRPDVEGLVAGLARRLLARAGDAPGPFVRLHGDVHPKNALSGGNGVALIDLDQSAAGPAAADLGSLLAHLKAERAAGSLSPSQAEALAHAFLTGYRAVRDLPHAVSLRWHVAAALLVERALRAVNRIRPEGLAVLPHVLAMGRDALAESPHA